MRIFLRILGYSGLGLFLLAHSLPFSWTSSLVSLGAGLIIIAFIETITRTFG